MLRCLFVFLLLVVIAGSVSAAPSVLELTGRADGSRPDILFLAPRLIAPPKAYLKALAPAAELGTVLPNAMLSDEEFRSMGPLPILDAAGYRFLPIRDVPWRAACARLSDILTLRRRTRTEDGIRQRPLCALLCEDAAPEDLVASLPALLDSDALIFLAPQTNALPLTVSWRNVVWPSHLSTRSVRPDHWVPTLAEIVGLPPPAETAAVSLLPLLTGVGYQRPLDLPSAATRSSTSSSRLSCTVLSLYAELPEPCPWVPDYTGMIPTERLFLTSSLPLPASAARGLRKVRRPQGLYIRTALRTLELTLPADISCVIRVKGRPVLSVWEPTHPTKWQLDGPEPVSVEFFLVLPAGVDPASLSFFLPVAPEERVEAL